MGQSAPTGTLASATPQVLVVLCTFPDRNKALEVGELLVSEKLVACVNIAGDVTSIYVWEGKRATDSEVLCVMKTQPARFEALRLRLAALHPYAVPEIIAIPAVYVHPPYAAWVLESTEQVEAR